MMELANKKTILAAWLLLVAAFIVYMFNVDKVYHVLRGRSYVVKLPDGFSLHAKGDLQIGGVFDHPPANNKYEEGKGFRGEFGKIANKSGNVRVRAFLKTPEALYEVIENRRSFWAHSMKIAVNIFASTSGLEKGIYQMGLYLSDDEGERFTWMNSSFEKAAGGPVEYIARPVALAPGRASADLTFVIEEIYKEDMTIAFQGWAVLDKAEMDDYRAYLTVQGPDAVLKAFFAPLFTRMDIASMHDDVRAADCGFRIKVGRGEFAPGNHLIKVAVQSRKTGEVIESSRTETRNF